jgi:hypothetical protein
LVDVEIIGLQKMPKLLLLLLRTQANAAASVEGWEGRAVTCCWSSTAQPFLIVGGIAAISEMVRTGQVENKFRFF